MKDKNSLIMDFSTTQQKELLFELQTRFEKHPHRHQGLIWNEVWTRLEGQPEKMGALFEMERTGGEPDVIGSDATTGEIIFCDCSAETPKGRRSVCYDGEAREARKEFKPEISAVEMAEEMGIELLDEAQYRDLQRVGEFDLKTSSWLKTPEPIRKLGGAIFGDRRYDHVFIYHNGAESYYGARAFRGLLKI